MKPSQLSFNHVTAASTSLRFSVPSCESTFRALSCERGCLSGGRNAFRDETAKGCGASHIQPEWPSPIDWFRKLVTPRCALCIPVYVVRKHPLARVSPHPSLSHQSACQQAPGFPASGKSRRLRINQHGLRGIRPRAPRTEPFGPLHQTVRAPSV